MKSRKKYTKFSSNVQAAFTANRAALVEQMAEQPETGEPLAERLGRMLAQNRRSILITASDGQQTKTEVLEVTE